MDRQEVAAKLHSVFDELTAIVLTRKGHVALASSYIAGGAVCSLVLDEVPNDYDLWFRRESDWQDAVEAMPPPIKKSRYSWTYRLPSGKEVQLVKSRLGEPWEVVSTFDFQHTHSYYDFATRVLKVEEEFVKSKRLTFVPGNLCHPVNTVQRVLKFVRRGYSVSNQSIADLMNAVGEKYEESDEAFSPEWGGGQGSR